MLGEKGYFLALEVHFDNHIFPLPTLCHILNNNHDIACPPKALTIITLYIVTRSFLVGWVGGLLSWLAMIFLVAKICF